MSKPLLLFDPYFRSRAELFSDATFAALGDLCRIEAAADGPMDPAVIDAALPQAAFYVGARPALTRAQIEGASHLRAVIEVSGAFHAELDYSACFDAGVEVLSCAPGFRRAVAEMGLAMILAAGRGLVAEHEAFRAGREAWLDDRPATDFSLFGQRVGFVGYGNIARELHRLLAPFAPDVSFYDPWVAEAGDAARHDDMGAVFAQSRVVVVTAAPTSQNRHGIGAEQIARMPPGAALVLLSRAHVLDFDAALAAARAGRITFATDVFPSEPVAKDHPLRRQPGVVLSPHRAAAVPGGRHPIGDMILHDIGALLSGAGTRLLQPADPARLTALIAAQQSIEADGRLPAT
ncbi:MAG: NAD(P)-dependent oxidoreductase [Pseudomonadota bacterium]